jgi:hypothetical protein
MKSDWRDWPMLQEPGVQPGFPPEIVATVKAIACELPARQGLPLSRFSHSDLKRYVEEQGVVSRISVSTIGRWLRADAIKPWQYRSWLFPRDPDFSTKAGPVLDLYQKTWQGLSLEPTDYVISTDEKTSIQARRRKAGTSPSQPHRTKRVEAEYERKGALAYLAAWDVHRARIYGRCERRTGIQSFERLVDQVMRQEPYRSARRVFWVMDNGSSHRGQPSDDRLTKKWTNLIPVHTPVHASWLNQIEIYFSILTQKALTPVDFKSLADLEQRILKFQDYYGAVAKPFKWNFNRQGLKKLMAKLNNRPEWKSTILN